MKVEIEIPTPGTAWSVQYQAGYVIICVDKSLANIKLTDQHEITVTTKR